METKAILVTTCINCPFCYKERNPGLFGKEYDACHAASPPSTGAVIRDLYGYRQELSDPIPEHCPLVSVEIETTMLVTLSHKR